MISSLLTCALLLGASGARAGLLTAQGAAVVDLTNAQRSMFSTNESIGFQQIINNGVPSANRISFQFAVTAPNGNIVFRHSGNSVRGTVGNAASQIAGIAISGFYQGPGIYTLTATASLDGASVVQTQTFTISSPNILLIYPPNGSQNLTDNPLTFQWYSSGAVTYRVTVGDNASLYNALFVQTSAGATSLSYPQNPSDTRQRLSTGQTYWWKVEGLDLNGNVVAQSQNPFSFSVANTALTRDLAVSELEVSGPPDSSGAIPFRVTVANQGNTTESNIPMRVTMGGLTAPGSPFAVPQLSPGDIHAFSVSAPIPSDMQQSLAIACLTIFDDTVSNNCKTLLVTRPAAASSTTFTQDSTPLSGEQIWEAIRQILKEQGTNLDGYRFSDMEGSLTRDELAALLEQLRQGQAQASLTGPPLPVIPPAQVALPSAPTEGPSAPQDAGAPAAPAKKAAEQPRTLVLERSWNGMTRPLTPKTLFFSLKKADAWKRLWQRLSEEPVPEIDFTEHTVIAIVAGGASDADRIEVEDFKSLSSVLTVRYRLVSYARPFARATEKQSVDRKTVPYSLFVIPRTSLKVKFEKITENSNDNE